MRQYLKHTARDGVADETNETLHRPNELFDMDSKLESCNMKVFGNSTFRPRQLEIIRAVMRGEVRHGSTIPPNDSNFSFPSIVLHL